MRVVRKNVGHADSDPLSDLMYDRYFVFFHFLVPALKNAKWHRVHAFSASIFILSFSAKKVKRTKGNGSRILRSSLGGYGLTAAFIAEYMKKCKLFTKKAQENRRDHLVQ
jgi:hypothetical protein